MLDKKQIWVIFLFKFKMGRKAVETTYNINNAFGPGTAKMHNAAVVQEVLQRRREPWRWRVQWPTVGRWQPPTERILLQLHEKLLKNSLSTIL